MKGKRYTTEDMIRVLRAADRGEKSVADICREENISGGELSPMEEAVWTVGGQ
jgi:transposase-like protein